MHSSPLERGTGSGRVRQGPALPSEQHDRDVHPPAQCIRPARPAKFVSIGLHKRVLIVLDSRHNDGTGGRATHWWDCPDERTRRSHVGDAPASMVDRVVVILGVFERSGGMLTLGQVSARSGLPRTSVHRILQQLVDARLLHRIANEYMLGLRMFEIGSLVVSRSRLTRVARPLMQDLSVATGHVVQFAVLDGQDVVYLEKIGGAFADAL